jgi:hypothetical protein
MKSPGSKPAFKLHLGVKIKRALHIMETLPPPVSIISDPDVRSTFHAMSFQARDQAKAAIKNKGTYSDSVNWLLLVGLYWMPVRLGPFTKAELTVQALKPSPSGDWSQTIMEDSKRRSEPVLPGPELYLLSEVDSYDRLEGILAETENSGQRKVLDLYNFH